MKTIKVKVFEYSELEDKAKEKARSWFSESIFDFDWYDYIYDEAKSLGFEITSFDLYRHDIEGKIKTSCGDISKAIVKEHGKTCETYKTAKQYQKDLKALGLEPEYNEQNNDVLEQWDANKEALDAEFFKALLQDYLSMLRKESEYMESLEYLEEGIEANGYTFTKDGKRFG